MLAALASSPATKALDPDPFPRHSLRHAVYAALLHFGFETAIDQRPPIVAAKIRIGDWEADTIIGANHKGVVMSHVERTSKYTKLAKLPDKNAELCRAGLRTRAFAAR